MKERLFHFLFPEVCIVCGKLLMPSEYGCCSSCMNAFETFPDCTAAGHTLLHSIESHFRGKCSFERAYCRYVYHRNSPLQKALHAMKYEGMFNLGKAFGRELGVWILDAVPSESIDCLVPVPLHPLKRIDRSFNQAEKIAEGMAEVFHKPVRSDILVRTVYTATQTGLAISERRKNLEGAFRTPLSDIPGRILLVDDVVTTGSTVVAAASALRNGGAGSISVAALALTGKE
ncbi:MAG: ComF family protein [Chlorobium limicola]|uniref:Phosphoribosyltransferase n=1 Tax=Chlorobium limicola (strain DSM 245 / NBRC 103803 / 6330) TaxID=290315 RepID=B3EGU4_CHLL2|nr:ComF family protein [Chlorobium limicola]ACD91207.1 phosphoribosyltransferase [Chlorobium limicola DSM 245]NTV07190.1 ComF family protein [Chlorobium limicola]NTV20111.1 ComF family protein [Chlorobium limicola]